MWGTSWRQRLRLAPLYAAVAIADRLAALMPARTEAAGEPWPPGVTVIIPDRDAPEMLARSARVTGALRCKASTEPWQVIVVANGAPRATYAGVAARFPRRRMGPRRRAAGLRGRDRARTRARARHGGTYLLNNDMTLEPERDRGAHAAARRAHVRDRLADLPAGRHRPPRGDGLHRLVRRSRRRAPVSRAGPGNGCARDAPLRERRRRAVSHGAASPAILPRAAPTTRSIGKTSSGACAHGATATTSCSAPARTPRTGIARPPLASIRRERARAHRRAQPARCSTLRHGASGARRLMDARARLRAAL